MSTECGGETDDRHAVVEGSDRQVYSFISGPFGGVPTLDARVKVRKDMTVGGCSGVVCLIYDDSSQPCRIKLL